MGGFGSGREEGTSEKWVVEHCRVLDVGHLQREACVQGGRGRSISEIVLNYRWQHNGAEWGDIRQTVMLTTTLCYYGGLRHWFRCPGRTCGRRVAKLYLRRRYFACRKCHDLRYRSQTENRANRALRVAFDIRERLGGSRTLGETFPAKPKGMRWRTYERLRARAVEAEIVYWSGWV